MPASAAPPETAPVAQQPAPPKQRRTGRLVLVLRGLLVLVALVQLRYGIDGLRIPSTATRDLAAWEIATAVGLLTIARRPASSEALLPTLSSAVGLTATVSVRGIASGRTSTAQETTHLWLVLAFAVTVALWAAADGAAE